MEKEILKSGNSITISLSSITQSFKLFQLVVLEFKKNGLNLKLDRESELNFLDIFEKNIDSCINGLANIITSENILNLLMEMGNKCIYESVGVKQKVSLDLFEKEEYRVDFFEVLYKIAIRNLKPFFPKALSK